MRYDDLALAVRLASDRELLAALAERGAVTRQLRGGKVKVSLRLQPSPDPPIHRRRAEMVDIPKECLL